MTIAATNPIAALMIEVGPGELVDKITILEIKQERIEDTDKRRYVQDELEALTAIDQIHIPDSPQMIRLRNDLYHVNTTLWDVENAIRECESKGDFGAHFISLARSVYQHNDRRAALKHAINTLMNARIVEQKSYASTIDLTQTGNIALM